MDSGLGEDHGLGPAHLASLHEELTRLLLAHGDIVIANPEAEQYLRESVERLAGFSPDAAKYWEALLGGGRTALAQPAVAEPLEAIETMQGLRANWTGRVDSALIEEIRAVAIGCPSVGIAELDTPSGIEVAHIFACWATTVFGGLRRLADHTAIAPGTKRERIANDRFVPPIRRAARINLFDAYLGRGLATHWPDAKRETNPAPYLNADSQESEWLLSTIGEQAEDAIVTIFTSYSRHGNSSGGPSQVEIQRAFKGVAEQTNLSGVKRLQLFLAPERGRGFRFPHERHLRKRSGGRFGFARPGLARSGRDAAGWVGVGRGGSRRSGG